MSYLAMAGIVGVATLIRFGIDGLAPAGLVLIAVGETLIRGRSKKGCGLSKGARLFLVVGLILCIAIWVGTALGLGD